MIMKFLLGILLLLSLVSTAEARSHHHVLPNLYLCCSPFVSYPYSTEYSKHFKVKNRTIAFNENRRHHFNRINRHVQTIKSSNAVGPVREVETAAGISIRVADSLTEQFQGFIKDIVEEGYVPKRIHCFASGGHVSHSRHYVGAACDFDQRGWGLTAPKMYHVSALAHKWGLRDGCDFKDCGHIDDGRIPPKVVAKHWPLMYKDIRKGG